MKKMADEYRCDSCWGDFKTEKYLASHKATADYCKRYKDNLFFCRKCGFVTKGVKNIEAHNRECKEEGEHSVTAIKAPKRTGTVLKLKRLLQLERLKSRVYKALIESNTNINLGDTVAEEKDGLHVYTGDKDLRLVLHQFEKELPPEIEAEKTSTTPVRPPELKKHTYRPPTSYLERVSEPNAADVLAKIEKIDAMDAKSQEAFAEPCEVEGKFAPLMQSVRDSRIYSKPLGELQKVRWSLFGKLQLPEYTNLVKEQVRELEGIFLAKHQPEKRTQTAILKALTHLESRLVSYPGYTAFQLDVEQQQRLAQVLELSANHDQMFVPWDLKTFCEQFYNYGVVVFPLERMLRWFLFNKYDFWNVIYLPLPKSSDDDPYSFYVLRAIGNNETRRWDMDCRLDDFSCDLIAGLLPHMIETFRKLYRDAFGDNDFRPRYTEDCHFTGEDCEQLAQNIVLLAQPRKFCAKLRAVVKDRATYQPTEKDKFNIFGDDSLQRKNFQTDDNPEIGDVVKQLFDEMSTDDAVDFYRARLT